MNITEDLIQTPPLWGDADTGVLAYGPFILEREKDKIVGMYLREVDKEVISLWDGARTRYFKKVDVSLRGMETKDAKEVALDPKRAGLTKEDVITKALLAFQPRSM